MVGPSLFRTWVSSPRGTWQKTELHCMPVSPPNVECRRPLHDLSAVEEQTETLPWPAQRFQENLRFCGEPSSHLCSQDDQSGATHIPCEFRVRGHFPMTPLWSAAFRRCSGETSVVSIANCDPFHKVSPSATTSSLRLSMSRTSTLEETLPPASRHTCAASFSREKPRLPKTPASEHPARWWPSGSSWRPHLQDLEDKGMGRRTRRRRSTLTVGRTLKIGLKARTQRVL